MVGVAKVLAPNTCIVPPKSFVIDVIPAVLALTTRKKPSLVTAPTMLPVAAGVPSCNVAQLQMNVPPV